jgi:hypothetical protein
MESAGIFRELVQKGQGEGIGILCYTFSEEKQMASKETHPEVRSINRRQFLKLIGLSGLSLFLTRCGLYHPGSKPPIVPSSTPAVATLAASPTPSSIYKTMAAIGQVDSYDPARLRTALERMLNGIGGLGDLIKPGARVGIKTNLTGGTWWDASLPVPATELFVTHPALVLELTKLLLDAGAGKVSILDGLGDERNFSTWGYSEMAGSVGAELIDLCKPAPYPAFSLFPVRPNSNIYDSFYLNSILGELDVFISVAKMKCHYTAGVTLSMKNLFGIAPISRYRLHDEDNNRSAFHETTPFDMRVPRVILDLNRARPIHLALIDGDRKSVV